MRAVGALYARLGARMLSRQGPAWVVPVSVIVAVLTGLLLWNWASQNVPESDVQSLATGQAESES